MTAAPPLRPVSPYPGTGETISELSVHAPSSDGDTPVGVITVSYARQAITSGAWTWTILTFLRLAPRRFLAAVFHLVNRESLRDSRTPRQAPCRRPSKLFRSTSSELPHQSRHSRTPRSFSNAEESDETGHAHEWQAISLKSMWATARPWSLTLVWFSCESVSQARPLPDQNRSFEEPFHKARFR